MDDDGRDSKGDSQDGRISAEVPKRRQGDSRIRKR
jgi:hypothetical protein